MNPLYRRLATSNDVGGAASPELTGEVPTIQRKAAVSAGYEDLIAAAQGEVQRKATVSADSADSAEPARALGTRDPNGVAADANAAIDRASNSTGQPLRADIRQRFESALDADLSAVRVHTGRASAEASSAVGARAYTVGQNIHFGAGQYRPNDSVGVHLLAHEVAHTRQQAGAPAHPQPKLEVSTPDDALEREANRAADAMVTGRPALLTTGLQRVARATSGEIIEWWSIQDEVAWNAKYEEKYKKTRPKGDSAQKDFDAERASGKVKAASSAGGTKVKTQISSEQLHRIIMAGGEKAAADRIAPMASGISQAFETMMIDTAQAQADYLAHMAGETGGVLEEVGGSKRSYAPFQGRGAVQVTNPENYAKALGVLQQRADQIEKQIEGKAKEIAGLMAERDSAESDEDRQKIVAKIDALRAEVELLRKQLLQLQEAINAIKADPSMAANEKYAFLISAAHMHRTGAVAATASLGSNAPFTGKGAADTWVTGGNSGMTFDERKTQNEGELAEINKELETTTDTAEQDKLKERAAQRVRLIEDMESAKRRGKIKEAVFAAGVRILGTENGIAIP